MSLHLSDLDELCLKVRNTYSKNYLKEAIVSYRSGAYRAALITVWIAVCVDIIEKIRELSTGGDNAAKKIDDQLKAIQPNDVNGMLAFEKKILDFACDDLQLISIIEKTHLERLKDDRNICAHPTFSIDGSQFTPSAEQARVYIVQAANYLLIHAPVKGKVVIERIYNLINEDSFPQDDEKAFTILSSDTHIGRVRESSVRNLIIILIKRLFRDENGIPFSLVNRISAALGAISRIYPKPYSEVFHEKLSQMLGEANDTLLKRVYPFLVMRHESWSKIEKAARVRLEGLICTMSVKELILYRLTQLATINQEINGVFQAHIKTFDSAEIQKLVENKPSQILKEYSIELFIHSGSFSSAYTKGCEILVPHGEYFTDKDMDTLFKGTFNNDSWGINQILNAGGIDEVFSQLYLATKKNTTNHKDAWLGFWEEIQGRNLSYVNLKTLLVDDGLVEEEVVEENNDEDVPF